ncbi:hypothetical protein QUR14_004517, partial [Enterobacter hormaechei]|nr:hypothetical protein [Enterobacter hormaechei]
MAFNDNGKRVDVPGHPKLETLLKSSERELVYYVHFLQCNDKTGRYISDVDYTNLNSIKSLIRNALYKSDSRAGDIDLIIDEMLYDYKKNAISEKDINWLKGERRACFWFLFNVLIRDTDGKFDRDIINNNALNTQSNSIYHSVTAWLDKKFSSCHKGRLLNKVMDYEDGWQEIKENKAYPWLQRKNEQSEIEYCYNYLKDKGMKIVLSSMSERDAALIFEFCESSGFSHRDIVMAFFDYIYGNSDNGDIIADSLKGKMSGGLSSWKNRKNKDEYTDLHFDIKN